MSTIGPPTRRVITVEIVDPKKDAKRIYTRCVMTRAKKLEIKEGQVEYSRALAALEHEDDSPSTEEEESAYVRAACNLITAMLEPDGKTSPEAGDLLFDGWQAGDILDREIVYYLERLIDEPEVDPT